MFCMFCYDLMLIHFTWSLINLTEDKSHSIYYLCSDVHSQEVTLSNQQIWLTTMDSPEFSMLSSLREEFKTENYIQPHYKESYRLAIDQLVDRGRDSYQEFLKGERIGSFLSEEELLFITETVEQPPPQNDTEEIASTPDTQSSSGTYWPIYSDMDAPDLDLGWPAVMHDTLQTNIDLLFHPPRQNNPTIKDVVRKNIQEARQVIKTTCARSRELFFWTED